MQYIILLIIVTILYPQDLNYSADILEKKVENEAFIGLKKGQKSQTKE